MIMKELGIEELARIDVIAEVMALECIKATKQYKSFHSAHEGLAIIWEEFEELKVEVFKKQSEHDIAQMRREAIHVGAMALRFVYDVCK